MLGQANQQVGRCPKRESVNLSGRAGLVDLRQEDSQVQPALIQDAIGEPLEKGFVLFRGPAGDPLGVGGRSVGEERPSSFDVCSEVGDSNG